MQYNAPAWLLPSPCSPRRWRPAGEHGKALGAWLLAREVASFEKRHAAALRSPVPTWEESAARRLPDLAALLETAAVIEAPAVRDALVSFLAAPETALPR